MAWAMACTLLAAACPLHAQALKTQQPLRWNADALGNHRYLVQVDKPTQAVRVVIPWRRRDAHPGDVAVIVNAPDGTAVTNVLRGAIDQASGELVFQAAKAGVYALYYQPYVSKGRSNYPTVTYLAPANTSSGPSQCSTAANCWGLSMGIAVDERRPMVAERPRPKQVMLVKPQAAARRNLRITGA